MGTFSGSEEMGETVLSHMEVTRCLVGLNRRWRPEDYNLFKCNCCHFANTFCMELGLGSIPGWVMQLARMGATLVDTQEFVDGQITTAREYVSTAAHDCVSCTCTCVGGRPTRGTPPSLVHA